MSARFVITGLGSQGDGVAETETGDVFIPFTLPGEPVTAAREKDRATLMSVLEASPLESIPPASISPNAAVAPCSIWKRKPIADGSAGRLRTRWGSRASSSTSMH